MLHPLTVITRAVLLIGVAAVATGWPSKSVTVRAVEAGWVSMPSGIPLFDIAGIAPGDAGSATLTVTNPEPFPVTFTMALADLHDDDNGCIEPEAAMGDTSCGPGGGELQFDLRLALTAGAAGYAVAAGTVDEWAGRPAVDPVALGSHETRSYYIGYQLPITSTNITQSDLVAFVFVLRLDQVGPDVGSEAPPVVIGATPALPETGFGARVPLMIGLSASLAGIWLYRVGVRRRRLT